jgi:large conductance mechanosensitive channel
LAKQAHKKGQAMLQEFKNFIAKGNVMDMAVGIIVGAAFTAIVSSLVGDLINPIIGLIIGGIDFSNMYFVLSGDVAAGTGLAAARESGAAIFAYGSFIMAVINFLIIAFVVFILVKMVNRVKDAAIAKEKAAAPAAPAGPTQEQLLADIRDLLKARV